MYLQEEIDGFERYWRRRKPGRGTAVLYRSETAAPFQSSQRWSKADKLCLTPTPAGLRTP